MRAVTGCGPISGSKQDMSVNTYTKGCYLLNHDDVIGTRRVSYILYMPLPYGKPWKPEYGGALELYPVVQGTAEPQPTPTKSIPPSWNQFIFFEVQPGRSHHSVEEVVVGQGPDGHQRLSISGWFHAAQPGEPGYVEEKDLRVKSTREQLVRRLPLSVFTVVISDHLRLGMTSFFVPIVFNHLGLQRILGKRRNSRPLSRSNSGIPVPSFRVYQSGLPPTSADSKPFATASSRRLPRITLLPQGRLGRKAQESTS